MADMRNYDDRIKNVFQVVAPSQRKDVKRVLLSECQRRAQSHGAGMALAVLQISS